MFREEFTFGELTLQICGDIPWKSSDICAPFKSARGTAAHEIRVGFSDSAPTPPSSAAHELLTYRWRTGSRRHILHEHGSGGFAYSATEGNITELTLSANYADVISSQMLLENAALFDILAMHGMLVLHSSYVLRVDGTALLFSGVSGAGKSTQAELWHRFAGARIINGDRTLVDVNTRSAHGIFYSGTSGICENVSAPVSALILPVQAAENRVSVPPKREAFMRILNQCAYYPWDTDSAEAMTELAARLVATVPVLRLECRADEGAVIALESEIMKLGER